MLQAFIIVLREGFESFLIVAIIFAYLRRSDRANLVSAVWWGVAVSAFTSFVFGMIMLQGANQPLWEGVTGLISAVLVCWFVIHMWRTAPRLKRDMENQLKEKTSHKPVEKAFWGVFLFTVFMITREGMETALLLIQIHTAQVVTGSLLGLLAAGAMALLWGRYSHLLNLKLFFQVTAVFLLLFVVQILIYSFHEFTEAGIFPNSEALHIATEPFSPDGLYGRWLTLVMIGFCAFWLVGASVLDRLSHRKALKS